MAVRVTYKSFCSSGDKVKLVLENRGKGFRWMISVPVIYFVLGTIAILTFLNWYRTITWLCIPNIVAVALLQVGATICVRIRFIVCHNFARCHAVFFFFIIH